MKSISISESEWTVMKILWNEHPKTLNEILDSLQSSNWSSTTIQTYLARLVKKGALTTERKGKGYLYYPSISETACQLAETKDFLSRVYDGSIAQMVTGFINSGNLSENELDELKKLITDKEADNANIR